MTKLGITDYYDSRNKSLLILMYHRINPQSDCLGLTIDPELFVQQLEYLRQHYEVISIDEAISRLSFGTDIKNSCVITFDDGYRDNYQIAAPLLAEHNLPATVFVTYDAIQTGQFGWGAFDRTLLTTRSEMLDLQEFGLGRYSLSNQVSRESAVISLHRLLKQKPDAEKTKIVEHVIANYGDDTSGERTMMNWAEVNELANSGLVTIGAHTVTHPILSRVPHDQAKYEITEGKRLIEEQIGRSVDFFAYPNGQPADIGPEIVDLVKEAGYRGACTTIAGRNHKDSDPFNLKRIDVTVSMATDYYGRFSSELFATMISGVIYKK